ncbi:MAG: hypothetical protein JNL32_14625, partial [Candidatus Kapabacteria bacterium]|nr:hypothetical protein [Candidatus Kapabacteria bacterium]
MADCRGVVYIRGMSDNQRAFMRRTLPFSVSLMVFVGLLWLAVQGCLERTGGEFTYALDDAYIHLSIAKNVVQHGVWGVSPFVFAGASSSPLWILLLAGSSLLPVSFILVPLLLNAVAGVKLLWIADRILQRFEVGAVVRLIALLGIVVFTPLVALCIGGMEHIVQCCCVLLLLDSCIRASLTPTGTRIPLRSLVVCALCAALSTSIRYESVFLVLPLALAALMHKRYGLAAVVLGGMTVPVGAYSWYSLAHGGLLVPNSVLAKSAVQHAGLSSLIYAADNALRTVVDESHLVSALVIVSLVFASSFVVLMRGTKKNGLLYLVVFSFVTLTACVCQFTFAKTGWFFRYEAYLMMLMMIVIALAIRLFDFDELLRTIRCVSILVPAVMILPLAAASIPFLQRATKSYKRSPIASMNIHEQQWQFGRFLRTFYNNESVVLNDIGAASFLANLHSTDLVGLSDTGVLRAKRAGMLDATFIDSLTAARGSRICVTYEDWWYPARWIGDDGLFRHGQAVGIPQRWVKCG